MRVCFINENIGGHGTLHHHLRIALEDHPEVDARFVDVHPAGRLHRAFRAPIPRLAERDLDLNGLRDHVAGSVGGPAAGRPARAGHGRPPLHPEHRLDAHRDAADHPSVVGTDATLAQSARLLPFREPTRHTDRVTRIERRIERRVLDSATLLVAQSEWAASSLARRLRHRRRSHPDRAVRHPHGRATRRGRRPTRPSSPGPVGRSSARAAAGSCGCGGSASSDHARLRLITPVRSPPQPGLEVINDLTRDQTERRDQLLAESAVFVFPSVMDTFGYAPIEAMAMGTPVVAYRATALPETVREGVSGLLVEPDDDDALGAAIERLLDDAPLRTRLGAAGAGGGPRRASTPA